MSTSTHANGQRHPAPHGRLTVLQGAALYVGAVLGTGVIALPALAAKVAGPASLLAWVALVLLSAPLAATFAALGGRYPDAGGVATYARQAFGARASAIVGWCFYFAVPAGAPAGAMFAGAPVEVVEALTAYGEKVGVAFQLSYDILDIASESAESGKTPGTDLREGVPTLPVLIARKSEDPADARLLELLAGDLTDDTLHAEALGLLRAHPAMAAARDYVATEAASNAATDCSSSATPSACLAR